MEGDKNTNFFNKALNGAKETIKILQDSLRKQTSELEKVRRENGQLKEENERLKGEIRNLLGVVPDWVKPNKTEEAKRAAKKLGAKKGHKAHPRKVPEHIDREVKVIPKKCPKCGNDDLPDPSKWHTHTQIDIPPITEAIVTRYHVGWCYCSVCKEQVSLNEKLSHSLYGPNLYAAICYWKFKMGLTLEKMQRMLLDNYKLDISTGQISEILGRSGREFNGRYEDIGLSLLEQPHLHADETGWRVGGDNSWLWSLSNKDYSYYKVADSRGQDVVEDILGKSYSGVLASDFYGAYNKIDCRKQKCWAHLLRELRDLAEKNPKDEDIKYYLSRMGRFFRRGKKLQENCNNGINVDKGCVRLSNDFQSFIFHPPNNEDLKRLSKRLIKYRNEMFTFIKAGVEPTNNNAEREIRPAVLMRKISYGNRSERGSETQAILMSVIRTCAKQNTSFLDFAVKHLSKN